jgi:hypothetical protein
MIFVEVATLLWAIWFTRNDSVFEKKHFKSFMQVILRRAYWLRFWLLLQHEDTREIICSASKALEIVALDILTKNRWKNNNRICF